MTQLKHIVEPFGEVNVHPGPGGGIRVWASILMEPRKEGQVLAMQRAGTRCSIPPSTLQYIDAHATGTPKNDPVETLAIKRVLGEHARRVPVCATKSMIGHSQGAASAIETIITTLVLEQQIIPPTINQEQPDPRCDLDYVPNVARQASVDVALTHSSGFGGVNTALILVRPDWMQKRLNHTKQDAHAR